MEAILVLEDGRVFRGRSFGASGETVGEVVFNTSMTGYQEILTDPSYRGQILVMTCPEIGNVGINTLDIESDVPQVEGLVVRQYSPVPSNWRATQGLHDYLRGNRVPGISEVDTRALTRHLRTLGAMQGILSNVDRDTESLARKARQAPRLDEQDLVRRVTCTERYPWASPRDPRWSTDLGTRLGGRRAHCVAYDFGAKRNIFRLLWDCGFEVTVVPATTTAEEALTMGPDAVFLSNGPGDPAVATYAVETVRALLGRVPIFGICLGHQLAGRALGARTFKLKFGHRGANHPVQDRRTGKVTVTSQNHGYAVDPDTLPHRVEVTHINLNDGTCEGFIDADARMLAVQYHPESSPGPHDSLHLFREFHSLAVRDLAAGPETREGGR